MTLSHFSRFGLIPGVDKFQSIVSNFRQSEGVNIFMFNMSPFETWYGPGMNWNGTAGGQEYVNDWRN